MDVECSTFFRPVKVRFHPFGRRCATAAVVVGSYFLSNNSRQQSQVVYASDTSFFDLKAKNLIQQYFLLEVYDKKILDTIT